MDIELLHKPVWRVNCSVPDTINKGTTVIITSTTKASAVLVLDR